MSASNHNLRVALVWNATVFQERTFTQTSDHIVTVGDDQTNLFVVPADGISTSFEMFQRTDSGYKLRVTDKCSGTFNLNGEEMEFDELTSSKRTSKSGAVDTASGNASVYEVELAVSDWGVIDLGQVRIFFQMLDKSEVVPIRGFAERFEAPLLLAIFVGAIGHIAFLMVAFLMFQAPAELEEMQNLDRFVKFMVDDVDDPLEEEETEEPEEDTTGKKAGGGKKC